MKAAVVSTLSGPCSDTARLGDGDTGGRHIFGGRRPQSQAHPTPQAVQKASKRHVVGRWGYQACVQRVKSTCRPGFNEGACVILMRGRRFGATMGQGQCKRMGLCVGITSKLPVVFFRVVGPSSRSC